MQIDPNDPTIDQASALLAQMEAEENEADKATPAETTPESGSAEQPDRAGQGTTEQVPSTKPDSPGGTPADKEPQKPDLSGQDKTTQQKPADKPAEGKQSKFAQSQQRLQGNWNQYHEAKRALEEDKKTLQRERDALVSERKVLEDERQKLNQPKYKPEDYEAYSRQLNQQASDLNRQAEEFESKGEYDKADQARDQAKQARATALQAKERADHLRANPPKPSPTAEQAKQEFEAKRKEWYGKAVQDFSDLRNKESALFKRLAATITKGAEGYDPIIAEVVNRSPEGMYYAARLVNAETLAASVAQKDKELVELRAKVKELDESTAIPHDAVAQRQAAKKSDDEMSDEELEAELKAEAARMGSR